MKSRKIKLLCLMTAIIFLCSCTVQKDMDVYTFCRRMNKLSRLVQIDSGSYYYDRTGQYCFFGEISQIPFILSLGTDKNSEVTHLRLTCEKENETDLTSAQQTEILELFTELCSVFTSDGVEEQSKLINGFFSAEKLSFCDGNTEFADGRFIYFIHTDAYVISLYCALNTDG